MKNSSRLAVFLPTYRRPGELSEVALNLRKTTANSYTLYFGVEADDPDSLRAGAATGSRVITNKYEPGYSNTIQSIYEASDEEFFIHANDDFVFLPHWDVTPISMFDNPSIMVVGLKQTEGDTHGSAISMIRRSYIEEKSGVIDTPNRVFYPYNHNYIDTEFTQTAQHRGVWALCEPQVIIHQHPGFTGKDKDEVHRKNDATVEIDKTTFESRKHLWNK